MALTQLSNVPKTLNFLFLLALCSSALSVSSADDRQTYIIHLLPKANSLVSSVLERIGWYESLLPDKSRLVYSYSKIINGFAARLSSKEVAALELVEGFLQAVPDESLEPQTTHSPAFLGLRPDAPGLWRNTSFGKGVVIGVLDSGIKVGHPSFRDDNGLLPPPPSKWSGSCEYNASDCNRKLIGAKTFLNGTRGGAPYDETGHGTHVAGTAAGMFVSGANVEGQVNGTAAGMAPYAHLAIYKVCSDSGCLLSDILAGLDSAIEDGVDILSISLGRRPETPPPPFYNESKAIGSFAAIEQGIFVSVSAGNAGPSLRTIGNDAPWMLTVGASSVDRLVGGKLHLKNGPSLTGETLYQPSNFSAATYYPLVFPGSSAADCSSLTGFDLTGMVVLCDTGNISRVAKGVNVKNAGGVAMIVANVKSEGYTTLPDVHVLPALHISYADGLQLKSYIRSEASPMAAISFDGTILGTTVPAPVVASFSSRGPSTEAPNILKPDIVGPGLNILAAWPSQVGEPTAASTFNVISGTSMAAPHLSGIAALLKSLHPEWSPAAIKSAIMTSADILGNDGNPIRDESYNRANFFAIGAGHVNPTKAADPGLIYDIAPGSYIANLCATGYTNAQAAAVAGRSVSCSDYINQYGEELNYPSFMVTLNAANGYRAVVSRNVTNVGSSSSSYKAQISQPNGVSVSVNPEQLQFTQRNEVLQYTITFSSSGSARASGAAAFRQGYLEWVSLDESTTVRSPIMVELA